MHMQNWQNWQQLIATSCLIALCATLLGCGQETVEKTATVKQPEGTTFASGFRLALETAKPGDVIEVPAGIHEFKLSLVLNTDGVTIRGAGMDKSILSFKNQVAGAEGLSVNASDFTIEDLAIEDTIGDALKVNEGNNIVIRRVRTEWTGGPDVNNGAYGIYPVQTTNTLVEGSVAIAASDAGIYVGQSKNVVVRNNRASSTSPVSKSKTPSVPMCTTMLRKTTPAAYSSSTCRRFPNAVTAQGCTTIS